MGQYSYSQPSSSYAESVKSRDRKRDHYGIPQKCWCGGELLLTPNTTGEYQGRLCYKCARSEDEGLHLNKFWDKAILEEIHDLHKKFDERDDHLNYLTLGPNDTKVYPSMLSAQIEFHGEEIGNLKKLVREIGDGLVELSSDLRNLTPRGAPTTFGVKEVKGFILGFLSVIALLLLFLVIKQ